MTHKDFFLISDNRYHCTYKKKHTGIKHAENIVSAIERLIEYCYQFLTLWVNKFKIKK